MAIFIKINTITLYNIKENMKKNKKKKVLIVSASAGAGHTISAIAINEALEELYGGELEITHIDVLNYTTAIMRKIYKDLYLYLAKSKPLIYGFVYKYTDKESYKSGINDWIHTRKFRKYLNKNKYDIIVTTHFLASNVIARMKKKYPGKLKTPMLCVLTDFGAHKVWLQAKSEYYIVPDKLNKEYFINKGVSGNHVYDYGIPVRTQFTKKKDRQKLRSKFGLSEDKNTILLLSGGFGVGPIIEIIKNLEKVESPHETIVICGKNEKLLKDCQKIKDKLNYNLIPVGYTTEIDEYMKASDIVITKPGGLTIAEALACTLPIVIVNPIIGQEDKNADRLLEEGCAIKISYLSITYYYIDTLLKDKSKFTSLKENISKLAKPDSAYDIAKLIYKEIINK